MNNSRALIKQRKTQIILGLILLLSLALRMQGLDWDGGNFYHPDERSIYMRAECMHLTLTEQPGWQSCQNRDFPKDAPGLPGVSVFFDKDASPLNPHWFPLGSIIIYLLVAVRFGLDFFMEEIRLQDLATAGRIIAALVDTISVAFLFFLGRRLFGVATGLFAAALMGLMVINIQVSHFYRPESFVMLLAIMAFWWMLNVVERRRLVDHIALGLVIGVTFAFRGSSAPILAPLGLTYVYLIWKNYQDKGLWVVALRQNFTPVLLAFISSLFVFLILQPYALLDFHKYFGDLGWETGIARTAGLVPYTLQYVGTTRTGLYELQQTIVWALGVPLGLLAWGGLVATIVHALKKPAYKNWLLLSWVLFLLVGVIPFFEVKFLRYVIPVLPVMVLFGSYWYVQLYYQIRKKSHFGAYLVWVTGALVLLLTFFYAISFVGIYKQSHPGIQASEWINANARSGDFLITDNHWDEGFPNLGKFSVVQLPMYEQDSLRKVTEITNLLSDADYIMSYSNRPWGSIARLPDRYPYSSAYYHALFSGELGYELVHGFSRNPSFLGITLSHDPFTRAGVTRPELIPGIEDSFYNIDLGYADENVVNYDRPLVLIWQNKSRFSVEKLRTILLTNAPSSPERALMSADVAKIQYEGGTWLNIFSDDGLNKLAPWLIWLLAIELIYVITIPIALKVMRWLPDRGLVLARPLGLLLVSWLVWWGASTGIWEFSRASILICILIITFVSTGILYRNPQLLKLARRNWRYLLKVEILFLLAYFTFVLIRAANPELWHPWRGGEKPMDFTYLLAVVKSSVFPPYDPWFSGGFINYYYFGFVIVASIIRLTGIIPEIAYNLAIPTFFAIAFSSAFSIGYNFAQSMRRKANLKVRPSSAYLAGLLVAFFVMVLGNIDGIVQVGQGFLRVLQNEAFGSFDYWRSSRMMPGEIAITEFPFWTFLFADLHAHLIAIPVQLLIIGLVLNLILSGYKDALLSRLLLPVSVLALAVGSLAAINTWDVPAYGLISIGTIIFLFYLRGRESNLLMVLAKCFATCVAFAGIAYLLWFPFHLSYDSAFSGFRMSQWRTEVWQYWGIHALLVLTAISWVSQQFYQRFHFKRKRYFTSALLVVTGILILNFSPYQEWLNAALLSILLLPIIAIGFSWLKEKSNPEMPFSIFLITLLLLSLGIGVGVDFVTAENDIDRMNTVFKFYLNAWIFWGIAGSLGLWVMWAKGVLNFEGTRNVLAYKSIWLTVLALAIISSGIFPIMGTYARVKDRFDAGKEWSLNGRAYQDSSIYTDPGPTSSEIDDTPYGFREDAAAIEFIRSEIKGSPIFLEGVTEHAYRWYPRVAKYTGLPSVLGWNWHQIQQRGAGGREPEFVTQRQQDVYTIYESEDLELVEKLLRKYEVQYIYIGPTERVYFDSEGISKFSKMEGLQLQVIYQNPGVTIYEFLAK